MFESSKLNIKNFMAILLLMLLLIDLSIILDLLILKPVLSFLFFSIVPGLLIYLVIKPTQMDFLKKIVLWVGLSIFFLMSVGLLLNTIYPLVPEPLSLAPVLISLNVVLIVLAIVAYWRNKDDFEITDAFNFKMNLKDKLISPLIFPFLLPLLAILGTYLMNISQNNILLLIMLFLIPLYLIAIVYLQKRVHWATYPLALWLISLSLLLMYGLTSSYLMGRDVHLEYYCFQLSLSNFHWDLNAYYNAYNACISVNILPLIYHVLSGVQGEYIFKVFMAFIGSIIPLIVYLVANKYISRRYAFFAGILFVFQLFFISLLGAVRQEIAILFFFLTIMVVFDFEINKSAQKVLTVIFIVSTLISHYSTAYVAFVLILPILLLPFFKGLFKDRKLVFTNMDIILISLTFILIWYFLVAKVQFASGAQVVGRTVAAAAAGGGGTTSALISTRGAYVLGVLGVVLKSLPNTISVLVHDAMFATILVGLYTLLRKYKYYRSKFGTQFLLGIVISISLLVLFVALPYISIAYDASRLFFQLIIFLAPVFIIGCITIARWIKKPEWDVVVILILLISLFTCVTYLHYSLLGTPYSAQYENDSIIRQELFIYNTEIKSSQWLYNYGQENLTIYSDGREVSRFFTAYGENIQDRKINDSFFGWNQTIEEGYIFLGHVNVRNDRIIDIGNDIISVELSPYSNLFERKSRVYDNGGSQVWW
jgi:uncharacterized membrane protein